MVDLIRKTYERNGTETRVDKILKEITTKYNSNHKKLWYELVEQPKKQVHRIFINEKLAIKVVMDCRTTSAHEFRTRFGFQ